jgi:hypothetical protein
MHPGPNGNWALDRPRYPRQDQHQIPLAVKYDTKPIWDEVRAVFKVGATGAAIVVAAYEAHFAGRPVSYSRN